ncbi:hypothetical protein K443DRAFT_676972 [Laccaria amethystina LaAM-08-1]|uniref:Uncharacterized protein n=1 Tax=Laccaria amethystina LaAM-08-1 TaxID=1095629 RepID=A0A0C9XZG8_9AGAR|nr:hypothetical protein K443DRAFT_676972 [Laccaria amethystina LaAM-08-1]
MGFFNANIAGSARHHFLLQGEETVYVLVTSYNHSITIFIAMQTVMDDSPASEMYSPIHHDRSLPEPGGGRCRSKIA